MNLVMERVENETVFFFSYKLIKDEFKRIKKCGSSLHRHNIMLQCSTSIIKYHKLLSDVIKIGNN